MASTLDKIAKDHTPKKIRKKEEKRHKEIERKYIEIFDSDQSK